MLELEELEKKLNKDKFIVSSIKGTSMNPFLKEGKDKVLIKKELNYKLYDVVLYKKNDKYVLHRIIGFKDELLLIRGDNTISLEYVPNQAILGVLRGVYSKYGYIDVDEKINLKYYKISTRTYLLRRVINKLKSLKKMKYHN